MSRLEILRILKEVFESNYVKIPDGTDSDYSLPRAIDYTDVMYKLNGLIEIEESKPRAP